MMSHGSSADNKSPFSDSWQQFAWVVSGVPEQHATTILTGGAAAIDRRENRMNPVIAACRRFSRWPWGRGLYLYGPVGCGKTLLATCTIRGMILSAQEIGWPVADGRRMSWDAWDRSCHTLSFWYPEFRFVNLPRLLGRIKETFNRQTRYELTTSDVIREYEQCDVLVLDDLGAEKATDWVREMLFLIIDSRYTSGRTTIITSNLSPRQLGETLSERIADRIVEMCRGAIVEIKCGSYR